MNPNGLPAVLILESFLLIICQVSSTHQSLCPQRSLALQLTIPCDLALHDNISLCCPQDKRLSGWARLLTI